MLYKIDAYRFLQISVGAATSYPINLPGVVLKEFNAETTFYHPEDAVFFGVYQDDKKDNVTILSFDSSRSLLILSKDQNEFKHSIYTTTQKDGFYLNDIFELIEKLGYTLN